MTGQQESQDTTMFEKCIFRKHVLKIFLPVERGHLGYDILDKTTRARQLGQDSRGRTVLTGRPDRLATGQMVRTIRPGQDV